MPEISYEQANIQYGSPRYAELQQQQKLVLENLVKLERVTNEFYLSDSEISTLDKYYLRQWQGSYLISLMREARGPLNQSSYIHHQDTLYKVNFLYVSPWQLVISQEDQFKISFRLPKGERVGVAILKKGK